jgi:hypothetical protein
VNACRSTTSGAGNIRSNLHGNIPYLTESGYSSWFWNFSYLRAGWVRARINLIRYQRKIFVIYIDLSSPDDPVVDTRHEHDGHWTFVSRLLDTATRTELIEANVKQEEVQISLLLCGSEFQCTGTVSELTPLLRVELSAPVVMVEPPRFPKMPV